MAFDKGEDDGGDAHEYSTLSRLTSLAEMATISQSISHLATGMAIYDEERLESVFVSTSTCGWSRPKRWLHFLRSRKGAACLLLADLIIVGQLLILFEPLISLLRRNEELFGPRVALAQYNPEPGHHSRRQIIPRILHQTSASQAIPDKWVRSQHSCKEAYAGFEYKVCSLGEGYLHRKFDSLQICSSTLTDCI